jgi:hypothetical protein
MPRTRFRTGALVLGLAAATATCSFPTDQSTGVYVAVDASSTIILRGTEAQITARVWNRVAPGDSIELRNADLVWSTSNPQLATVAHGGHGVGRVTGVNPGLVQVRVVAPAFEKAAAGTVTLRVANPLEIDSVTPDTVRYGQRLRVYGVGARQVFFATIGDGGVLFPDSAFDQGEPVGLGSRVFWVPYPARSSEMLAAGAGQFVAAPESTFVVPLDIYEPNETAPASIDLDAPPIYPNAAFLRFVNPALAYEDLRNKTFSVDWYRFRTTNPNAAYTFLLETPNLGGTHASYLTRVAGAGGAPDPNGWTIGNGSYNCKGYTFTAEQAPHDKLTIALTRLQAGQLDFSSVFTQQGRYSLAVVQGYIVADPRVQPDRFEENDNCDYADDNYFGNPSTRISIGVGQSFSDTLTIDNPHDVDWFVFRAGAATTITVKAQSQDLLNNTAGPTDRSDIDLYLFKHPNQGHGLNERARDTRSGTQSSMTIALPAPGDYYLVVVDSAGVPAKYSVCIAVGLTCTLKTITVPAAAPAPEIAAAPTTSDLDRPRYSRLLGRWITKVQR